MEQSKITFIYAYEEEDWSTPLALAEEFVQEVGCWYSFYWFK